MPLNTQIIRNGEPLQLRWGDFHIAAMALAASFDAHDGPLADPTKIYEIKHVHPYMPFPVSRSVALMLSDYGALAKTPLNYGVYTLRYGHSFIDLADGEIIELLPGDELRAIRGF